MDRFLETHKLPIKIQQEIENLKNLITSNEKKSAIKNLPVSESPGPVSFIGEFYQIHKEKLTPILLKLFQNIEE